MRLTVDVHAHALLPKVEAVVAGRPRPAAAPEVEARRQGPVALAVNGTTREPRSRPTDVSARLAAMDAQGVDVQLVSPSPSHYHYWADEKTERGDLQPRNGTRTVGHGLRVFLVTSGEDGRARLPALPRLHPRRTSRPGRRRAPRPVGALRAARRSDADFDAVRGGIAAALLNLV